jgi:pimeloyl-ACP methyl ester carboxylesterase
MTPTVRTFDLGERKISALQWGDTSKPTLLAVHGWLDNAESFYKLAPLLSEYCVIAIDLAGHGQSGWRSADAGYPIWSYVEDLRKIHLQLGPEPIYLLGHSLGAGIASLYAGIWPEAVIKLGLIENLGPVVDAPEELTARLRGSFDTLVMPAKTVQPRPAELLFRSRATGRFPVPMDAAKRLVMRACEEQEDLADQLTLRIDPRLKYPTAIRLTEQQVEAALGEIIAPALLIVGEQGLDVDRAKARMPYVKNIELVVLPGGHHLHLEDAVVSELAQRFNSFYAQ